MGNINLSGSGKIDANGSVYEHVGISGSGKIDGTLRCKSMSVSGSGRLLGDVFCDDKISVSGSGRFEGNVDCYELSASGASHFSSNIKCRKMGISGACHVDGSVEGGDISISGVCRVNKNMSADNVKMSGAARVDGLLNAENIEIRLGSSNSDTVIGEIGCTNLRVIPQNGVKSGFKLFGMSFGGGSSNLCCQTIEGDNLLLCNTVADVVRGKNVKIGPGCNIKRVEYTESIEFEGESAVGEQVKI